MIRFYHFIFIGMIAFPSLVTASRDLEIDIGYRQDKASWSLAGAPIEIGEQNVYYPNILSELEWKNLNIIQLSVSGCYVSASHCALKIAADGGRIYHGENSDSDYTYDDKLGLYSLSKNDASKGYVYDLSGGIGYQFCPRKLGIEITPLVGYSCHVQNLHLYNGVQEVCFYDDWTPCSVGSFPNLNSSYKMQWSGPWLGVDFSLATSSSTSLYGGLEWHFVRYHGKGHWNLRTDISDFHHYAYGQGLIGTLGINHNVCGNWIIGLIAHYRHFWTNHGIERITIFDSVLGPFEAEFRFNEAKWLSGDVSCTIDCCF